MHGRIKDTDQRRARAISRDENLISWRLTVLSRICWQASKRWHPDRFQSRFGSRIAASDSAGIAEEVNKISQQVNREWEEIRAKHG